MPAPPRDIPGFYHDPNLNKYFRIQPNHTAPGEKAQRYTTQAVLTREAHDQESRKRRRVEERRSGMGKGKGECVRLKRSMWWGCAVSGFELGVRLGVTTRGGRAGGLSMGQGQGIGMGIWTGIGEGVRRQYASLLQVRVVLEQGKPGPRFSVEGKSKCMFTTGEVDGRWDRGREMCIIPLHSSKDEKWEEQEDGSENEDDDIDVEEATRYIYDAASTTPILNAVGASAILPISEGLVIWAHHRLDDAHGESSTFCFSRRYASDSVPWQNWRDEFGAWGTSVHQLSSVVWDIAAPGQANGGLEKAPENVVLATDAGIKVCTLEDGRMLRDVKTLEGSQRREYTAVRFKSEKVFMAGRRSGGVHFYDLRVRDPVTRIGHGSAVTGIRSIRNDDLVLVNGLQGAAVYDLRYSSDIVKPFSRRKEQPSGQFARTVLQFEVPESMQQRRHTMGFDYDEELNIMASASTDFMTKNTVGLWDCGTGKRIGDGALAKKEFREPVTCLQMVDLRGQGPSAKSILTMSAGVVEEWCV